ncbi:MAG: hypothetical protein DCC55_13170 [Chloroflexi bacterium]|nr:MAG: hypothetical protein DCC55_13170 [Chloroflexota bacterium]
MRRVLYQSILLLLFGVLLIGACQSTAETTPPPAPPAQENTPTPAASTSTPVAQVSPLSAAESPLAAAESPLAAPGMNDQGKAMVVGRLFSQQTGQPLVREVVRLAEVYCPDDTKPEDRSEECFWALSNAFSPSTFTDEAGYFEFLNVEARDYVLMAGDYIGKYAFMEDEDGKPIIITAPADEATNVGEHHLEY